MGFAWLVRMPCESLQGAPPWRTFLPASPPGTGGASCVDIPSLALVAMAYEQVKHGDAVRRLILVRPV